MLAPAALGTKHETRHTSLFYQKLGSPNRFSRPLIIIFSTKGFSNSSDCSSILMHSKLSPINLLNPELNPICYLLALLGAHHFLHVSRIRVKLLTFRLLMYIYGAPILDVSRSHNDAAQSVGLLWTSDQLVVETST